MSDDMKGKSANEILAELMLEERREKQQAKQDAADKKKAAAERQMALEAQQDKDRNSKQGACDHLMGNHVRGRERPSREIPDLSLHTYSSGRSRIKCNRCRFEWRPKDSKKNIFRDGKTLPNPTGQGWKEMYEKVIQNSNLGNKPSRAFRLVKIEQEEFV
jgi:hypothetical protein